MNVSVHPPKSVISGRNRGCLRERREQQIKAPHSVRADPCRRGTARPVSRLLWRPDGHRIDGADLCSPVLSFGERPAAACCPDGSLGCSRLRRSGEPSCATMAGSRRQYRVGSRRCRGGPVRARSRARGRPCGGGRNPRNVVAALPASARRGGGAHGRDRRSGDLFSGLSVRAGSGLPQFGGSSDDGLAFSPLLPPLVPSSAIRGCGTGVPTTKRAALSSRTRSTGRSKKAARRSTSVGRTWRRSSIAPNSTKRSEGKADSSTSSRTQSADRPNLPTKGRSHLICP